MRQILLNAQVRFDHWINKCHC